MSKVGSREKVTQDRVIKLFRDELGYTYLGNWEEREGNSNIEVDLLSQYLTEAGYSQAHITKAIRVLETTSRNFNDNLYNTNKNTYSLIRYGADVKTEVDKNTEKVHFINWKHWDKNHFAIAEEVTIHGNKTKRPDLVLYVNGIALGVIELKRSTVSINEGIRQSTVNQKDDFIRSFFATIQFIFSANDTEGLAYGTIGTPEKYYLRWKEDLEDNSRLLSDKYLLKMCHKQRFLEYIHDFVVFDGGAKKLPRVHQYFGTKAAQTHVHNRESGIIWHTQGSGKSITMVYLAKWILENNPDARVVVLTDRDELDKQIERVFTQVGEKILRTSSGIDLMTKLTSPTPRLLCSLIHKFGKKAEGSFDKFIKELESQPSQTVGEVFVFVDECHRTQSGRLHRTMKAIIPEAVFIGFTGTPLLKKDKKTSLEVFGRYIHTYKFNEGVSDGVILDLVYEARDIDQRLSSQKKIDEWFEIATEGKNDFQKAEIKKRWGTKQKVLSSKSKMQKVVNDIEMDFRKVPRLSNHLGNAILVAGSIYEACRYYELFQSSSLKNKCAVVTSYNPQSRDITTEDIGANTETEKEFVYNLYTDILKDVKKQAGKTLTEAYEDWSKMKFSNEPASMKLLIVVSKLLTGYDAPPCSYLYIDKTMQDHGLFQAICRVNRLDSDDKQFGYIVDYRDLFKNLVNDKGTGAIQVYTSELDTDTFGEEEIDVMLHDRLAAGKERLDTALEALHILCEPVAYPRDTLAHIHYFCGNTELESDLKEKEVQRSTLYKKIVSLIRSYANIKEDMDEAGYTDAEAESIRKEVDHYLKLREEIKQASGETLDLKSFEADMRHLIDNYIQANEPETISAFGDMPLLEIISKSGIGDAIASMPSGIKNSKGAVAETIENNVRSKIIKDHLMDPAYFDEMSKLLDEIIKQRRAEAIDYEEFLAKIAALAVKVQTGKSDETPDGLKTSGQRALYNNLGKNEDLALILDRAVKQVRRDGFRGNQPKEMEIKAEIYKQLLHYVEDTGRDIASEPPGPYGLDNKVEAIFNIITEQGEY